MEEQAQSQFRGHAIVEIFGHSKAAGFITSEYFGSACLFRIDTPPLPEREFVLKSPEYVNGSWTPVGATVRRPASPARSELIGPNSIFRLRPCDETVMLAAIEEIYPRPLILLKMPKDRQLASAPRSQPQIDPVCGSEVDPDGAIYARPITLEHAGKVFHFCTAECREEFKSSPDDYVPAVSAELGF